MAIYSVKIEWFLKQISFFITKLIAISSHFTGFIDLCKMGARSFTPNEIENMKKHKYNGTDNSILGTLFLRSFWNWLVEFFPKSVAPNTITFIGFLIEFVTFVITFSLSHCLTEKIPSWACILNGIGLFTYQTLDNLDGRQARRTGTSSPLGQFFDHGCDALTGVFIMIKVAATLNMGSNMITFIWVFTMGIGFVLTSWEEYITHSFYLGYLNGPDEGILLLSILHVFVGIFPDAADWFKTPIAYGIYLICLAFTILPILFNVLRHSISDYDMRNRAFVSIIPVLITIILSITLVVLYPQISENVFFTMLSVLILQYQSQLIIVSYLVLRPPFKLFDPTLYPYWIFMCLGFICPGIVASELLSGIVLLSLVFVILYFDIGVIDGLSTGLGVSVFSITPVIESHKETLNIVVDEEEEQNGNHTNYRINDESDDMMKGQGEFEDIVENEKEETVVSNSTA
ncbi:Cholinephosphotransferase 1 [Tritrichomonas foetus]|uniref:Cholinephosphotransferase 1 n=1 Tax=Tritrichomonas foetus TaxID=1144522 RepID=A0A1J4JCG8_9EUKA|nr:Cholinephosphotransferase 1 [Tritrichomonas foetus]|eukprot:OHS96361.1 Cholinephosphotransferase 1 [Tritrichomonas foetus]